MLRPFCVHLYRCGREIIFESACRIKRSARRIVGFESKVFVDDGFLVVNGDRLSIEPFCKLITRFRGVVCNYIVGFRLRDAFGDGIESRLIRAVRKRIYVLHFNLWKSGFEHCVHVHRFCQKPGVFGFDRRRRRGCKRGQTHGFAVLVKVEPEHKLVAVRRRGTIEIFALDVVGYDKFRIACNGCAGCEIFDGIDVFSVLALCCDNLFVNVRSKFVCVVGVNCGYSGVFDNGSLTEYKFVRAVRRPILERITRFERNDFRAVGILRSIDRSACQNVFHDVVGELKIVAVHVESDGIFCLLVLIVSVVVLAGIDLRIARHKHRACEHGNEYDAKNH